MNDEINKLTDFQNELRKQSKTTSEIEQNRINSLCQRTQNDILNQIKQRILSSAQNGEFENLPNGLKKISFECDVLKFGAQLSENIKNGDFFEIDSLKCQKGRGIFRGNNSKRYAFNLHINDLLNNLLNSIEDLLKKDNISCIFKKQINLINFEPNAPIRGPRCVAKSSDNNFKIDTDWSDSSINIKIIASVSIVY